MREVCDVSGLVSVVLTCWGGGEGVFHGEVDLQFLMLCPVFLHLKHHPSFIHLACLMGVSLDKVTASMSMVLGSL